MWKSFFSYILPSLCIYIQGVRPQCITLWFNIWTLQRGNFSKVRKESPTIYALKKFRPIFVVGLLMKIWGHVYFEKKNQKREFSLGNIGEFPKNWKCARRIPHPKEIIGESPILKESIGKSPIKIAAVEFCSWTVCMMNNTPSTFFIFGGFNYVT